jgi:hypothetical protein
VGSSWGQLRTQERELSRLKKAAERAAAGAAAAEAAREEAARGAEEEVERLQAELVASRVRQEDALTKQREARSSLKVRLQSALSTLDVVVVGGVVSSGAVPYSCADHVRVRMSVRSILAAGLLRTWSGPRAHKTPTAR